MKKFAVRSLSLLMMLVSTICEAEVGRQSAKAAHTATPSDFTVESSIDFSRLPKAPDGRGIVGRVNGRPIYESRFRFALETAVHAQRIEGKSKLEALRSGFAGEVFRDLVRRSLILAYAEQNELSVSEREIQNGISLANRLLPAGKKLQDIAIQAGQPVEIVKEAMRDQILEEKVTEFLGRNVKPISVNEAPTSLSVSRGSEPATSSTEIRARHIVLRCPDDAPTTQVERVRKAAERALADIRDGLDFDEAVRRYSQDRLTRDLGGDLGYFGFGRMYPEFEQAAFKLQKGEVSEVVRTAVGFHIIQVTDRQASGMNAQTQAAERQRGFSAWLNKAVKDAKVEQYF